MTTVSYTNLRNNLSHFLDQAEENSEEIVVTRGKGRSSIILSLDDFLSLQETAYLLFSKNNRQHLEQSIRQVKVGKTVRMKF